MTRPGRRRIDHYLLTRIWERIVESDAYNPQWKQHPTGPGPSTNSLADVIQAGLWLQRAVAEKWEEVIAILVDFLSKSASLEDKKDLYEESPPDRIAAAYFLWPFHAGRYYNYLEAAQEQRLESRQALCDIQALLYNNMRGVLDLLRLWFEEATDEGSRKHLTKNTEKEKKTDEEKKPDREKWRPRQLIEHVPDLCAVDRLALHILDITKARPLIRKAMENIQKLSLNSDEEIATEVGPAVKNAFTALHVTQMTVFYYHKASEVKDRDDIPLYELVYQTGDKDPTPAKLIPFDTDEILARNFRKLATHIYSRKEKDIDLYPNFIAQRNATIEELKKATIFISDGATTKFFLSNEPPARKNGGKQASQENIPNGSETIKQAAKDWPIWYRKTVHTTEMGDDLPDWNNWDFWWEHIEQEQLYELLFPGPSGTKQIHENDHMSAYWDNLAASEGEFHDPIVIPTDCPTGAEYRFGYLMELMLRREKETRTSFFFALAQTYGKKRPRLYQFVGGTFLGLEWPGVPFSEERFKALGARVRGLVMAVAHYTITHAVKIGVLNEALMENSFEQRVTTVVTLLRGTETEGQFPRNGHLLFATPLHPLGKTDHDYYPKYNMGWKPSRHQIKSVFVEARDLEELPLSAVPPAMPDRKCEMTWKALFYLGGEADRHNTLDHFLKYWDDYQACNKAINPQVADRGILCHDCLRAALSYLLGDLYEALAGRISISKIPLLLPSRPGIRFLIALCRFITNVQSQATKENASILSIEFEPESVTLTFDRPSLLQGVWGRITTARANFEHTTGILRALQDSLLFAKVDPASTWEMFLNSTKYACHLKMEKSNDDCTLHLRWTK